MARAEIRLLGGFEVRRGDAVVPREAWRHRRAAELVKMLALAPDRTMHRELVLDALWPDLSPAAAAANLHKAAHLARAALGPRAVVLRNELVALWPDSPVTVDAVQLELDASTALRDGDPARCAEVAASYPGELLPDDRYASWSELPRERIQSLRLALLRQAGQWALLLAEDPTDEEAHRNLMRAHAGAGRRSQALRQFDRLRDALDADLDVQPSAESVALYDEIANEPLHASPIQYVRRGGVSVAYQRVEGGMAPLLLIPGWVSHLALDWQEPRWVEWCERMARFATIVRFDKRGTGLSDRPTGIQPLEERMRDARSVLEAAGFDRAHVMGWSEGGPLAILLAATYPDVVESLVLYGTQACFHRTDDYPWGYGLDELDEIDADIERDWGLLAWARMLAPAGDERFTQRWAAYSRAAASPAAASALNRANMAIDVRDLLPMIRVPTLVLNRSGDRIAPAPAGRYMAEHIPGARFIELAGEDHLLWLGDLEQLCGPIEEFVRIVDGRTPPRWSG